MTSDRGAAEWALALLERLALSGDEIVLDAGAGRGA
jgi:hypothetical protein